VSAGGVTNSLSAVTFSNSNGVSFGLNAGVITASASGGGVGSLNVSAGTLSSNVSAITFSNTNGVSWGFDGSNITATVPAITNSSWTVSDSATSATVGRLAFVNSNGVTFGLSTSNNGQQSISASYTVPTVTNSSWTVSDSATSATVGRLAFVNSNNVSFALSTSNNGQQTIKASIATTYAGTGFTSTTTAGTAIVGTLNTSGLSLGVPPFLTTSPAATSWTVSDSATSATVGRLAFTASNGLTLTLSTSNNGNHTVIGSYTVPTVTNSSWTASDSVTSMTIGRLAFTASNGLTLTLSTTTGGLATLVGSYTVPSVPAATSWTVSDSATSATVGRLAFSNANGVSFALSTSNNGQQTISASIATTYAGTGFTSTTTAGTAVVGTLNTSGLSLAVPAFLTTAAQSSALMSYWANLPALEATTTTMCQSNSFYVFPITLDNNMSISYARLLASFNFTSTSIATSAVNNATGASTAFSETVAFNILLYTAGTGGSSRSLQEVYSTSAGMTWAVSVSQASTSNATNQSISQIITYPSLGFTTATASTQYSVSTTLGPISTTQWSNLSAQRFLDIPFATSLSAGNYWMALNRFSGTVGGKNLDVNATSYGLSQQNLSFADMNVATNLTNCAPVFGLGLWTQANAATSASIGMANVSATTSYMIPMVQFIRQV